MRKLIWLFFIRWIECVYAGSNKQNASQIIDGCLAVKDGLYKRSTTGSK